MEPLPTEQKAFFLESLGGMFAVKTKGVPCPGPGQILVRVEAAGLNPIEWKIRAYKLPYLSAYPHVLGCEGAGVVVGLGEGVGRFVLGDRVYVLYCFAGGGGCDTD